MFSLLSHTSIQTSRQNQKVAASHRDLIFSFSFGCSIFATDEFKEEERFDRTLRTYGGPEDFPKDAGGNPIDFQTRIHRDIMRRASEKILCGKTITPVLAHEVYGDPRWHSGGFELG